MSSSEINRIMDKLEKIESALNKTMTDVAVMLQKQIFHDGILHELMEDGSKPLRVFDSRITALERGSRRVDDRGHSASVGIRWFSIRGIPDNMVLPVVMMLLLAAMFGGMIWLMRSNATTATAQRSSIHQSDKQDFRENKVTVDQIKENQK